MSQTNYIIHFTTGAATHRVGYARKDGSHGTNRDAVGSTVDAVVADQVRAMLMQSWSGKILIKVDDVWSSTEVAIS